MLKNKYKLTLSITSLLCLFPLFLWLISNDITTKFGDFKSIMTSLGQITALAGMVMFSISFIQSTRLKILDRYFQGLNILYRDHNRLGQIAFILLLAHPLFLLPKYTGGDLNEAAKFFLPIHGLAENSGIIGLVLMIILIVMTLYLRPKYHIWKWTHKFFGLAFIFGFIHLWNTHSDTSRYLPLRIYMITISTLGLIAFIYKSILGKYLIKKSHYTISEINKLNESTTEIVMLPETENEKLNFQAGQFIFISFNNEESHPFTISSAPADRELKIIIKKLGDYTLGVNNLTPGMKCEVEGAFGAFTFLNAENKNQIWIAGGIGITPFLSLTKALPINEGYNVDLIYCVSNRIEAVKIEEFNTFAEKHINQNGSLKINVFETRTMGRLSVEAIEKICGSIINKDIFICAPVPMIQSLKIQLKEKNIPNKLIHSEEFGF